MPTKKQATLKDLEALCEQAIEIGEKILLEYAAGRCSKDQARAYFAVLDSQMGRLRHKLGLDPPKEEK